MRVCASVAAGRKVLLDCSGAQVQATATASVAAIVCWHVGRACYVQPDVTWAATKWRWRCAPDSCAWSNLRGRLLVRVATGWVHSLHNSLTVGSLSLRPGLQQCRTGPEGHHSMCCTHKQIVLQESPRVRLPEPCWHAYMTCDCTASSQAVLGCVQAGTECWSNTISKQHRCHLFPCNCVGFVLWQGTAAGTLLYLGIHWAGTCGTRPAYVIACYEEACQLLQKTQACCSSLLLFTNSVCRRDSNKITEGFTESCATDFVAAVGQHTCFRITWKILPTCVAHSK